MLKPITIDIHKTYFVVTTRNSEADDTLRKVTRHLESFRYVFNRRIKRMVREKDKDYFSYDPFTSTYRFTIGIFKDFMITLGNNGYKRDDLEVVSILNRNVQPLGLKFKDKDFILRDYQQIYSDVLVGYRKEKSIMLVDLMTGYGKSCIAAHAITRINECTFILVLPRYVEKWVDDMYKYTNIKDEDICVIKGAKSIIDLMLTPRSRLGYKVYIASITTMNYMISDYEDKTTPYSYPMSPDKFMDHLGVGVILNDETHQHFHALLKISLYMNVNQIIGLSATLDSNRPEMKKMYNYMFPSSNRISNIAKVDKYIKVKAIEYRIQSIKGLRYMVQGYNHNAFEQSIILNKILMYEYFHMIYDYFKESYLDRKLDGERILIFMASVNMCTLFTSYLKRKHPELDIRRYCEDDPYENVINAEVSVSTILSASTAIDIPRLITVINTIPMASLQANLQSMGRLRKIPDRDTWYYYFYTPQIPNQKNMHKIRRDTIRDRVKFLIYEEYSNILRTR